MQTTKLAKWRLKTITQQAFFSQEAFKFKDDNKMLSWTVHSYGGVEELQFGGSRVPIISKPDDVLVKVKAASVNPIDAYMLGGYGKTSLQVLRNFEIEFPLILGRDFSGSVIGKGHAVSEINIGDEVYGFVPIHKQGTFADIAVASKCHLLPKPKHLSHEQSASLVYTTMTAWSGLYLSGNMLCRQNKGLKVLVLGGSGGVGTSAIQLLKSQGCVVYSTCSNDAMRLVTSLGTDLAFDRNDPDFVRNVQSEGKYHVILDACNMGIENLPAGWQYESFVTLNSPLLVNNDKYGLFGGMLRSIGNLLNTNRSKICSGKTLRWGYFVPSRRGFEFIHTLICQEKIRPVIQQIFPFNELPSAIKTLTEGHARGKIVLNNTT
ncbi:reticulon-4-interacting protein 1, mitochondrial isoform X1 [Dendroctonus ponderosae]|uniref:Enoyl reductase (ER) domain-containing protein n=1 Tax=Dendroctonus ponderosae TaxID=77166 RepID=J3JXY0_DENPD